MIIIHKLMKIKKYSYWYKMTEIISTQKIKEEAYQIYLYTVLTLKSIPTVETKAWVKELSQ